MRNPVATFVLATAVLALAAPPADAGGLPPLDLARGGGSFGVGGVSIGGDVAIADGLTVGGLAYLSMQNSTVLVARTTWTAGTSPWGSLGLGGAAGAALTSGGTSPLVIVGPVLESPPFWVRLRASLQGGLYVEPRPLYDSGDFPAAYVTPYGAPVLLANRTAYNLALLPGLEVVFPLGTHAELTFFGYNLVGFYGRW